MILKQVLDLRRSIDEYRRNLNDLRRNKGLSNPDVIRLSQKLDEEIVMYQKILYKIHPFGRKFSEPFTN
jgi:hypothetical protein